MTSSGAASWVQHRGEVSRERLLYTKHAAAAAPHQELVCRQRPLLSSWLTCAATLFFSATLSTRMAAVLQAHEPAAAAVGAAAPAASRRRRSSGAAGALAAIDTAEDCPLLPLR